MSASAFEKSLARYDYAFPSDRIAASPASPRDSAKLMVYDRIHKRVTDVIFHDLPKFLPRGTLLVLNDTKVIPARLVLKKSTGGAVRFLFIDHAGKRLRTFADRSVEVGTILR